MSWTARTPDGSVTWATKLTGDKTVIRKVEGYLASQYPDPVEALPVCPEFDPVMDDENAVLIALYKVYWPNVDAPDAPWDVVVPPIPDGAVS